MEFKVAVVTLAIILINIRLEMSSGFTRDINDMEESGNATEEEITKDGGSEAGKESGIKVGPEIGNETDRKIDIETGEDIDERTPEVTTRKGPPSRIVLGERAKRGQIPYQVAIYYKRSSGQDYLCGGSLISSQWVLTAAHCVNESSLWYIKLGSINRYRNADRRGERYLRCTHGVYPRDYGKYRFFHDIGLIKLPTRLRTTRFIKPIRLPRQRDSLERLVNENAQISGWGKVSPYKRATYLSPDLLYTELVTIRNTECSSYFSSVYAHTICARGIKRGAACQGDSGGPLTFKEPDGERTQIGVFAFVHSTGCFPKYPSGYIRVGYYLQWIKRHTGIPIRP